MDRLAEALARMQHEIDGLRATAASVEYQSRPVSDRVEDVGWAGR